MRKFRFRKRLCCSVVAILSLFAVCDNNLYAAANDSQQNTQESKIGTKAPDFTITKDGKSVSLADFGSRFKVLNFSSSSSVSSDVAKLEEQYKGADIVFVTLSVNENAEIAKQYGVESAPAVCIISPSGDILSVENGYVDLSKNLKDIFGF